MEVSEAAEHAAIDRTLIEQSAQRDPRPVDPALFAQEMERLSGTWGGNGLYDKTGIHSFVERHLRVARANQELVVTAPLPIVEEMEAF